MDQREAPENPVHILQIHGTNDETIGYQGGDIQDNRYPSALQSVRRWANYNGCSQNGVGRELRDLEASLPGHESGVLKFEVGCKPGGSAELWTIASGTHVPVLSDTFAAQVVEWLLAHPKDNLASAKSPGSAAVSQRLSALLQFHQPSAQRIIVIDLRHIQASFIKQDRIRKT